MITFFSLQALRQLHQWLWTQVRKESAIDSTVNCFLFFVFFFPVFALCDICLLFQNQPSVPHGNHPLRCPSDKRYEAAPCLENVHISHELVDIDLFCAADPKEAITFLEKTKEKVSPQNTTSKILAKKYCFMTEGIKSPVESKSRPLDVLCLFLDSGFKQMYQTNWQTVSVLVCFRWKVATKPSFFARPPSAALNWRSTIFLLQR